MLCIHPRDYFKTPGIKNSSNNVLFTIHDNRNNEIKIKCFKAFQNFEEPIELNVWSSHENLNVLLPSKLVS
uniref:Uncharacterized protein n=1 Tax=Glossina palpalis gambiensis TaxID=67801 RepID=A0A1B0BP07_9MUSC